MNEPHGCTGNPAEEKPKRSSAALALLVGLALLLPGAAALAGEPIPGVDIYLGKNPGGNPVAAPTGADGTYQFKGLAPGKYDLSIAGQRVQTISVDKGTLGGVLSREPDGKASITFNGQVGVVPDLPSAPVNTSRSNKKAGIAKGAVPTPDDESALPDKTGHAPKPVSPGTGPHGSLKAGASGIPPKVEMPGTLAVGGEPNDVLMQVSTTRGTAPRPDDVAGKLPGILRVINNSETDTATVHQSTPVNGIGGTGGGRLTFKPTDLANAETSNRDHIDQDAQTDIKKSTARQPGGPGDARIRVSADVSTLRGTAPPPKGGDDKLPGLAGEPIPGVDVNLSKEVGGGIMANLNSSGGTVAAEIMASFRTDSQGNFHFDKLPAGNYKLIIPGLPSQALSVGTDGIAGGSVKRGSDGSITIFDRRGNSFTAPGGDVKQDTPGQAAGSKAAESPVGFGSGNNAMGAGPGAGLGAGPGMLPPGAAMGGAGGPGAGMNPMSPGAGGPMGGSSGGAMRP